MAGLTFISGPDPNEVENAKNLCMDLLENVKSQYQAFKERPRGDYGDRRGGGGGGGGGGGYGGDRGGGGYGDRNRSESYGGGGGYSAYGGAQSPANPQTGAAMSPTAASGQDYSAQWAQYMQQASAAGQDPYAAYGGYEAFMRMYQQYYYGQQGAAQGDAGTPMGAGMQTPAYDQSQSAPPPPPPTDDQPPPPPPPGADSNGYNAQPPPPGL